MKSVLRKYIYSMMAIVLLWPLQSFSQVDAGALMKKGSMSYGFVENKGQIKDQNFRTNQEVRFMLSLPGNNVVLKTTGFSYDTYITEVKEKSKKTTDSVGDERFRELNKEITYRHHRVDIELVGANPEPEIITSQQSDDYLNVFTDDEEIGGTKVYHYGKVTYKNIYPNIDLEFIAAPGQEKPVEYNFLVYPGGDINAIQLKYKGANRNKVRNDGVELELAHGNLIEKIPASYWMKNKGKVNIGYKQISKKGKDEVLVGFVGEFAKTNDILVIDPLPQLSWATYYGGTGSDGALSITLDETGNVYMAGQSYSNSSIATAGAHQTTLSGTMDGMLVKFTNNGVRLWATYYGGNTELDQMTDVAASGGYVYVTGQTKSTDGIATAGSHQPQLNSFLAQSADAFLVKFNSDGVRQWGTYYGGQLGDYGNGVAVDEEGNVFVAGQTQSTDAISTLDGFQPNFAGGYDAFLVKFNSSGVRQWGTYYGGVTNDFGYAMVADNQSNVYLTGETGSPQGIATSPAHKTTIQSSDAFLVKFNGNGVRQWGTYFGGSSTDTGGSVATDANGDVYIAGWTSSTTGIATTGAHQLTKTGGTLEAFLSKFSSSGVQIWGTYYGGPSNDWGSDVSTDLSYVYLAGSTIGTSSQIATSGSHQPTWGGGFDDGFVAKFNASSGGREWGTYYGGAGNDGISEIAIDSVGNVFFAGQSESTNAISTSGSHQPTLSGTSDAFVGKFYQPCIPPEIEALLLENNSYACAIKFSVNRPATCEATYAWDFGDGQTSTDRSPLHAYSSGGTYNVSVTITFDCLSCDGVKTLTKQVVFNPASPIIENVVVQVSSQQKPQVLATTASSFSDAWDLQYEASSLDGKNSYVNGTEGVWRNDASYVYKTQRSASGQAITKTDGTFTLNAFNWQNAVQNAVPNWIKATAMTAYSPYSFELENKDALGIYSAALYDYFGQLPVANGANMRHKEMAYTSFEELSTGRETGNWIFGTLAAPEFVEYEIGTSNKNIAVVKVPPQKLAGIVKADLIIYPVRATGEIRKNLIKDADIVCIQPHPSTSAWSIVVFQQEPSDAYWSGKMRLRSEIPANVSPTLGTIAHSGKSSLRITADQTFKQEVIELDSAKSYVVNAWVSVNNTQITTPQLATNLGFDVLIKRKNNQLHSTFSFQPVGPIIEGWQQIRGNFTCPIYNSVIEIKFKPGSTGTAWYDDLRLHPENGNMKSYVYDLKDYRLQAILDEENFASYFFYDKEGNLYLTKKETAEGIKTLTENISYQVER